jgi:hypothetical protein
LYKTAIALLKLKGTIQGKEISIAICPNNMKNHINVNLVNQLLIPIEKKNTFGEKQYAIKELQLTIDDYTFISQFNVTTMYKKYVDIILGSSWMET